MNDILFYESFRFAAVSYSGGHHTDCRKGSPFHYVARMRQGGAEIDSDSGRISVKAGDWFYIPFGCPYQSYWTGDPESGRVTWDSFGFTYIPDRERAVFPTQIFSPPKGALEVIGRMPGDFEVNCLSVGIFYEFFALCEAVMARGDNSQANRIISDAVSHMRSDPSVKINEIAAICHVSETTLYELFRKRAGCTPTAMRHRILAEKAAHYLTTTDMTVEEISGRLGFCSSIHFRKIIREVYGKTPGEIRRESLF